MKTEKEELKSFEQKKPSNFLGLMAFSRIKYRDIVIFLQHLS